MTKINRIVLATFLGVLCLVVVVAVAFDVWLYLTMPDGSTISWSMALLGRSSPILVYAIGFACGAAVVGLPLHFWWGMIPPDQWDELVRLRAEVASLKDQAGRAS